MLGQVRRKGSHALVETQRQHITQVRELGHAQLIQQSIGSVQGWPVHIGAAIFSNQLPRSLCPGAPLKHAHMGVVHKALKPDRCVSQGGLTFSSCGVQNPANQTQGHGVAGTAGFHAGQHHAARSAGRFTQPAQSIGPCAGWQQPERGIGAGLHRPLQQDACIGSRRIQLQKALKQFFPGRFQVKKTVRHRRVRALGRTVHQHLGHPREATQAGIHLFGTKELSHDLPAFWLQNLSARETRSDVIGNLVCSEWRQHHQASVDRIGLLDIGQGLAHRQHGVTPAQGKPAPTLCDGVGPSLLGGGSNRDSQCGRI